MNDVKQFIASANKSDDVRDHIHVAWYVVDLAHARFQSFEANLCDTLLSGLPIFIILNKADTGTLKPSPQISSLETDLLPRAATPEQARIIRHQIQSLNLPNCKAIFEVGTTTRMLMLDDISLCSLPLPFPLLKSLTGRTIL